MTHFEDLWNQAEESSKSLESEEVFEKILHLGESIYSYDCDKDQSILKEDIGELLFYLSGLSARYNINVFEVLKQAIESNKIDQMESNYNFDQNEFNIQGQKFKVTLPEKVDENSSS